MPYLVAGGTAGTSAEVSEFARARVACQCAAYRSVTTAYPSTIPMFAFYPTVALCAKAEVESDKREEAHGAAVAAPLTRSRAHAATYASAQCPW